MFVFTRRRVTAAPAIREGSILRELFKPPYMQPEAQPVLHMQLRHARCHPVATAEKPQRNQRKPAGS